jgi:hypothetical protein
MTTRLCEIERKIDELTVLIERLGGLRGFGTDILANVIGNIVTR